MRDSISLYHMYHTSKTVYLYESPIVQNSRHFTEDIYRCILVNEKRGIFKAISPGFVPKCVFDNNPALVLIMTWCRVDDKPLSDPIQ